MDWTGKWRNQYGSTLQITDDSNDRITGVFRTALPDSSFYGRELPIVGIHRGDCIGFAFADGGARGDAICSFTGLFREGKLQTLWYVLSDSRVVSGAAGASPNLEKTRWPHAAMANADTFERVERA
jgi:hypothetical protein